MLNATEAAIRRCQCLAARSFYAAMGCRNTAPYECERCCCGATEAQILRPCDLCGWTSYVPYQDHGEGPRQCFSRIEGGRRGAKA